MKTKKYYNIAPPCLFEVLPISMDEITPFNLDKTIHGKLSPHMTPYLKVIINGVELEAALDTGAYRSHIGAMAAKALSLQSTGESMGRYPVVGNAETPIYNSDYNLIGLDNIFHDEFYELPFEFTFPIILGSKFIGACKEFKILPETMSFELKL